MSNTRSVLVTGTTGTLGSHAAAAVLTDPHVHVIAPVRAHHGPDVPVATVAEAGMRVLPEGWRERFRTVPLPADLDHLPAIAPDGVDEVIHCAGSLSYTDVEVLEAVNVRLTSRLVEAAATWGVDRFVHISTAFAGGYPEPGATIPEQLHDEGGRDPTPYTASKRRGEHIVAAGGVPHLILRPSIVIGDSTSGRYSGPRYGLYQLWSGLERFLLDEWHREVHFVAPRHPLPLLHQDAFRAGLLAAREHLDDGAICHLTSRGSPDVRSVAALFFDQHLQPEVVHYYDHISDVTQEGLPRAQRALLRLAQVNLDIAGHDWRFDTSTIDRLVAEGAPFVDASLETVHRCQEAYFGQSARLARFRAEVVRG
ncbi:MAG: hypothetical protein NVS3B21_32210 [Acidimicrobiales bacterium]